MSDKLNAIFDFQELTFMKGSSNKQLPSDVSVTTSLTCKTRSTNLMVRTEEDRLIFLKPVACIYNVAKSDGQKLVVFSINKAAITFAQGHVVENLNNDLVLTKSKRIYPSGNIMNSYEITDTLVISQDQTAAKFQTIQKHDEIRYLDTYSCTK